MSVSTATSRRWKTCRIARSCASRSLFGSAVVNLTDRNEDPRNLSDGFQPLRTRLGLAYQDDCLELAFTWRRDYVATGDARKGNTFQIYFAFRNIGLR
jgi:LPS-assembly protein